jgi:dTDP-glucose 4,6-dehydratase
MARVLVTGGAGFLGSHICDALVARGDEVVVADNFITGRRQNLAHLLDGGRLTLVEQDVAAPLDAVEALGPFAAVLHLASPASPADFERLPLEILAAGSTGTRNTLELAARSSARFLLASTSEVYGDPLVHPQAESYWGNVNSIGPRSAYDEAKRFAEALTVAYRGARGVDTAIVRIFNTYGDRMRADDGRVVSSFVVSALAGQPLVAFGDGRQTRSFCYVADEVAGILALLDSGEAGPINIGSAVETSILDLAHRVIELTGSTSEVVLQPLPSGRIGDPSRRLPDVRLARARLQWEPSTSLADGLKATIAWFREELGVS